MSLPRYPEYKDSGVEWLGEIPAHWQAKRLKHSALQRDEKLDSRPKDLPYIGLENISSWTGRIIASDESDDVSSTVTSFYPGDVVFGKLRPYLAKAALLTTRGVGSTELAVLKPTGELDASFLCYQILSHGVIKEVTSYTYGAKMPRVSSEQIASLQLSLPPLSEQQAIAAFLDRETTRIDTLIAKQEEMIALLQEKRRAIISHAVTRGLDPDAPLKDSGVEWLGQVPEHWQVKRLKFLADVRSGVAKGRDLRGRVTIELPYLRVANVQDGYLDLSDVTNIELAQDEVLRYLLQSGDVLMNEGGDFDKLGRGYVWNGEIEPCVHQNHVFSVRPLDLTHAYWINLVTQATYAKHYFVLKSKQTTNLASISSTNIREWPVVIPPPDERQSIMNTIQRENSQIDKLLNRVREATARLQEHRTSLISAAVTGKIDVRGL